MRVVDTSAWIEWLLGRALGKRLEPELPSNDERIVPTIVQYELMRAPIRALSRAQADIALAFSNKLAVRQLDIDLANVAVDYTARHSLAIADAIIYAAAMNTAPASSSATLISQDCLASSTSPSRPRHESRTSSPPLLGARTRSRYPVRPLGSGGRGRPGHTPRVRLYRVQQRGGREQHRLGRRRDRPRLHSHPRVRLRPRACPGRRPRLCASGFRRPPSVRRAP